MRPLLVEFTHDPSVLFALALVGLDFALGVSAAIDKRTFRLGWVADFLRADVLRKLIPYFAIWTFARVGGDVEIAGVGVLEETVLGAVVLSLLGSIAKSLQDLGFRNLPDWLASKDEPPPQP